MEAVQGCQQVVADQFRAEEKFIGEILHEPENLPEIMGIVRPTDFTDPIMGKLYAAVIALHECEGVITAAGTCEKAGADNAQVDRIEAICAATYTSGHVVGYAEQIHRTGERLKLQRKLRRFADELNIPTTDVPEWAAQAREACEDYLADHSSTQQSPFTTAAAFLNRPAPEWLFPGIIRDAGLGFLIGAPGAGKSFFALELAMCVATGRALLRRDDLHPTRKGWVAILLGEAHSSWAARLGAYLDHFNLDMPEDLAIVEGPPNLSDPGSWATFKHQLDEETRRRGEHPAMVVVDTLAACSRGADENSASDMGVVTGHLQQLAAEGACVIVLHHMGKSGLYRGSTALHGSADWFIDICKDGDSRYLQANKLRDSGSIDDVRFEMVPHGDAAYIRATDAPTPAWLVDTSDGGLRNSLINQGYRLPGNTDAAGGFQDGGVTLKGILADWNNRQPIIPTRTEHRQGYEAVKYGREQALVTLIIQLINLGDLKVIDGEVSKANTKARRTSLNAIVIQAPDDG